MERLFWQGNGNKNCQVAFGTLKSARPDWWVALQGDAVNGARPKSGVLPKGRGNSAFVGTLGLQMEIEFERRDKNKTIYLGGNKK